MSQQETISSHSADSCSLLGEGVAMCDVTKVSVSAVTSDASQTPGPEGLSWQDVL